jgi:S-formylglutathione hydrolase FrmB
MKGFSRYILFFLLLFTHAFYSFAAEVDTISIYSVSMKKNINCVIILPDSYQKNLEKRFPVVYLLHGYSGNYSNWIAKVPGLKEMADNYNFIIVCPDGAYSSWYFDSPVEINSLYKTYVGIEVPAFIDSAYHSIPQRKARAITGLSMGGHGAIYLAWNFPETFGAAGSMSGAVNILPWENKYGLVKVLGDTTNNKSSYNHSVVNVVKTAIKEFPELIIDCGIDDPFIKDNRLLNKELNDLKIPHDYIERPGKHNWEYWQNAVCYQLLFFNKFFEKKD